jgi:hypothetical protein
MEVLRVVKRDHDFVIVEVEKVIVVEVLSVMRRRPSGPRSISRSCRINSFSDFNRSAEMGGNGLGPLTSAMSTQRSNQLS